MINKIIKYEQAKKDNPVLQNIECALVNIVNKYFEGKEASYEQQYGFCNGVLSCVTLGVLDGLPDKLVNPKVLAVQLYGGYIDNFGDEEEDVCNSINFRNAFIEGVIYCISLAF